MYNQVLSYTWSTTCHISHSCILDICWKDPPAISVTLPLVPPPPLFPEMLAKTVTENQNLTPGGSSPHPLLGFHPTRTSPIASRRWKERTRHPGLGTIAGKVYQPQSKEATETEEEERAGENEVQRTALSQMGWTIKALRTNIPHLEGYHPTPFWVFTRTRSSPIASRRWP